VIDGSVIPKALMPLEVKKFCTTIHDDACVKFFLDSFCVIHFQFLCDTVIWERFFVVCWSYLTLCKMIVIMGAQICGQTIGQLIPVDDMHQRKAEMARLADAFIALPGMYNMYCSTLLAFTVPILNDDHCLKIQVFLHGALELCRRIWHS
jgi:hypothetical protein